jgi:hypothetical protein
MMESPAFGTAPGPPSEYFCCIPTYEIQSPYHSVYYYGYQPDYLPAENNDFNVLSSPSFGYATLERWQFGKRICSNNERPSLEIVSLFFFIVVMLRISVEVMSVAA